MKRTARRGGEGCGGCEGGEEEGEEGGGGAHFEAVGGEVEDGVWAR